MAETQETPSTVNAEDRQLSVDSGSSEISLNGFELSLLVAWESEDG